jgi:hypothetical protein
MPHSRATQSRYCVFQVFCRMILLSLTFKDAESRLISAWREVKDFVYAALSVRCTQREGTNV